MLPTFKQKLSAAESKSLDRAGEVLSNRGSDPAGKRKRERTVRERVKVGPGSVAEVAKLLGET